MAMDHWIPFHECTACCGGAKDFIYLRFECREKVVSASATAICAEGPRKQSNGLADHRIYSDHSTDQITSAAINFDCFGEPFVASFWTTTHFHRCLSYFTEHRVLRKYLCDGLMVDSGSSPSFVMRLLLCRPYCGTSDSLL